MQHLSGMDRARSALERGQRFPSGALPGSVALSWERCREFGLDPRSRPRQEVVTSRDVADRRDAIAALRRLALAEMQLLHSQIAGSNFVIALGDADGIVLDTISDHQFQDSEAGRSIIPGSVWGEERRGTNALGLVVRERQPVAIYGREHYFACHGHLSCMAAPILDASGKVLGLLDASCTNEARQQHTHALVRMAASQIENGLMYLERSESFIFAFHPRAEYLDTLSAGLVAVSRDGAVRSINRPGSSLLSGLSASAETAFEALFEASFAATVDGLLSGGLVRIRDRAGSVLFMVCRQIARTPERAPDHAPQCALVPTGPAVRKPAAAPLVQSRREPEFVCEDPRLREAVREVADAVSLRMPVHVTGQTGTGKELMARFVHAASGRSGELVAVNCGALPEQLFIAEIFGHERGAYTNARNEGSPGLARAADKGTLFLDEVADIPLPAQTALLRFLDSMEVRAVGANRTVRVDVQIVSATNCDLNELVAARQFRSDLLYRLNAFSIELPALDTRSDFAAIVRHMVDRLAPGAAVTDAAVAALRARRWPGNMRELEAVLKRALLRTGMQFLDEGAFAGNIAKADERADGESSCPVCRGHPFKKLHCVEIRDAHRSLDGNIALTARRLGLSRTTVYKHIR